MLLVVVLVIFEVCTIDLTSFSSLGDAVIRLRRTPLSKREWGEHGYASNPIELATHRLCGVRVRVRLEP
eukprot:6173082-Pleurochrysis_carterae.AAC.2